MKKLVLLTYLAATGLMMTACASSAETVTGKWELASYGDISAPTPALPDVETTVIFDEEGLFHGSVGCNSIRGTYEIDENKIKIGAILSTRMLCRDSSEQENTVLGILSDSTPDLKLDNGQLILTNGSSIVVLTRK